MDTLRTVDRLLRGGFTASDQLRAGRLDVPVRTLVLAGLAFGAVYGTLMGTYSVLTRGSEGFWQLLASTAKVPLLFLLTLAVTFPSLYVFSALAQSRLKVKATLRLLLAALVVDLAVLASFGPVTAFFSLSTKSYAFMIILNVFFFGVAGIIGVAFLKQALDRMYADPDRSGDGDEAAKKPRELGQVVFTAWLVIFGAVGAQMGWILRPFVGSPDLPFTFFREREQHFLAAVGRAMRQLFE